MRTLITKVGTMNDSTQTTRTRSKSSHPPRSNDTNRTRYADSSSSRHVMWVRV